MELFPELNTIFVFGGNGFVQQATSLTAGMSTVFLRSF